MPYYIPAMFLPDRDVINFWCFKGNFIPVLNATCASSLAPTASIASSIASITSSLAPNLFWMPLRGNSWSCLLRGGLSVEVDWPRALRPASSFDGSTSLLTSSTISALLFLNSHRTAAITAGLGLAFPSPFVDDLGSVSGYEWCISKALCSAAIV